MRLPLEIVYAGLAPQALIERAIRAEVGRIDALAGRVVSARVAVVPGAVEVALRLVEGTLITRQAVSGQTALSFSLGVRRGIISLLPSLIKLDETWSAVERERRAA